MTLARSWILVCGVAFSYSLVGCGDGGKGDFKTAAQVKKERPDAGKKKDEHDHGHHHHAPHHGSLTMVGDHQAQIELTVDAESGQLTVYILDGEAEKPLSVDQAELEIAVTPDGAAEPLSLKLAPAEAEHQDEGFIAKDDKLKGVKKLKGTLTSLKLKGKDQADEKIAVEFDAKKAAEEAEEAHKDGHGEHAHGDAKDHKHSDKDADHKDHDHAPAAKDSKAAGKHDHDHDDKDHKHDDKDADDKNEKSAN